MVMVEEWRVVEMLFGAYELSNAYRLRNVRSQRIMRPSYTKRKAITYQTCVNGIHQNYALLTLCGSTWPEDEHGSLLREEVDKRRALYDLGPLPKKTDEPEQVVCAKCEKLFSPNGHNDKYCANCRKESYKKQQKKSYLKKRAREAMGEARILVSRKPTNTDIFNEIHFCPGCTGPADTNFCPLG